MPCNVQLWCIRCLPALSKDACVKLWRLPQQFGLLYLTDLQLMGLEFALLDWFYGIWCSGTFGSIFFT